MRTKPEDIAADVQVIEARLQAVEDRIGQLKELLAVAERVRTELARLSVWMEGFSAAMERAETIDADALDAVRADRDMPF